MAFSKYNISIAFQSTGRVLCVTLIGGIGLNQKLLISVIKSLFYFYTHSNSEVITQTISSILETIFIPWFWMASILSWLYRYDRVNEKKMTSRNLYLKYASMFNPVWMRVWMYMFVTPNYKLRKCDFESLTNEPKYTLLKISCSRKEKNINIKMYTKI